MNLGCGSKVSRFLTTTLLPSSLDQVLILGIIYLFRKQTTYVFAFSSNVYYLSWSLLQGHIRPHLIVFLLSTFQHSTFPLPLVPLVCRHSLLSLETIWRHIYWSVDCKIQTYTILNALFVCASYPSELSVCFLDTSQILNIGRYPLQNSWRLLPLQKYPFRDGSENALSVEPMVWFRLSIPCE